ncbi:hypothetical protein IC229_33165 [Spirosoma sp. BT702]|uniref:Uncharacterized protein n=1 Tax=Spirosoma profusum TaxID=2771354 RepID=A0A927AW63_9BACT|nr:hypothetical protein [Spirosoma profusum]MBD2705509.1 hypothetical protein [Spirosoma profusum]
MRVNRPNLLSWYNTAPDTTSLPTFRSDCRKAALITYIGEVTQFYMNLKTPGPVVADDPTVTLVEYRTGGVATEVSADLGFDQIELGVSNPFGSMLCPDVVPGLYYWKIEWGSRTWTSAPIEVIEQQEAKQVSIRAELHHRKAVHGVRYPWLDSDYMCRFRFRAIRVGAPQYPVETSSYREVSTGIVRNYNIAADKLVKFQTTPADPDLLEGIQWMLLHDTILLNGISYTTREFLTSQAKNSNLENGTFALIDNSYATSLY